MVNPHKHKVHVGDLVEFYSSFDSFMRDYEHRNPGIVIETRIGKRTGSLVDTQSAKVMWSDSSVTSEHSTYLKMV